MLSEKTPEIIIVALRNLFSNKYSLSAYHSPGIALEIWDTSMDNTKIFALVKLTF